MNLDKLFTISSEIMTEINCKATKINKSLHALEDCNLLVNDTLLFMNDNAVIKTAMKNGKYLTVIFN